jgi:hypothetical protein
MSFPSLADLTADLAAFLSATWRAVRVFMTVLRSGPGAEPVRVAETRASEGSRLPSSYGRTRLVMLPVNPYTLHAYWEVTSETLMEAERRMTARTAQAQAALRFYDAGSLAREPVFDIDVRLGARNWFVPLWAPGRSYDVELGLKGEAGEFVALARYNAVRTPRAWPEPQVHEHFMYVSGADREQTAVLPPTFRKPVLIRPRAPLSPTVAAGSLRPLKVRWNPPADWRAGAGKPRAARDADLAAAAEEVFIPGISSMPSSTASS